MDIANCVLAGSMINVAMSTVEPSTDAAICGEFVGYDPGAVINFLTDSGLQSVSGHLGNHTALDASTALHDCKYRSLPGPATTFVRLSIMRTRFASDVTFIGFDNALKFWRFRIWGHGEADSIHQEQRGF